MGGAGGMGGMDAMGGMSGGGMPGGMNPAMFQAMMSNPAVQNMMQQVMQNPEMLQGIIQSNPMLSQMTVSLSNSTGGVCTGYCSILAYARKSVLFMHVHCIYNIAEFLTECKPHAPVDAIQSRTPTRDVHTRSI